MIKDVQYVRVMCHERNVGTLSMNNALAAHRLPHTIACSRGTTIPQDGFQPLRPQLR